MSRKRHNTGVEKLSLLHSTRAGVTSGQCEGEGSTSTTLTGRGCRDTHGQQRNQDRVEQRVRDGTQPSGPVRQADQPGRLTARASPAWPKPRHQPRHQPPRAGAQPPCEDPRPSSILQEHLSTQRRAAGGGEARRQQASARRPAAALRNARTRTSPSPPPRVGLDAARRSYTAGPDRHRCSPMARRRHRPAPPPCLLARVRAEHAWRCTAHALSHGTALPCTGGN